MFKEKNSKFKILLSFEGKWKTQRRKIMIRLVHQIIQIYSDIPESSLSEYFLTKKDFKTDIDVIESFI